MPTVEYPAMVNSVAFVGDFGFDAYDGPFDFEMEDGVWTAAVPTDPDDYASLEPKSRETMLKGHGGHYAVAFADGEAVAGGKCVSVDEQEDEGRILVAVDAYPMGGENGAE